MHADTGRESKSLISKQILIPLKVTPNKKPVRTIIFKNKWYGQASFFFQYNKSSKINTKYFLKEITLIKLLKCLTKNFIII